MLMRKVMKVIPVLLGLSTFNLMASEVFKIDPMHTYVLWKINHFGFSNPSGKWLANGTLILDEIHPNQSKVDVQIKVASIVTGIPELDKHLKSKSFFDVEKYPQATFVSDSIETQNNHITKVHGVLTLKGISKPVALDVQFNKLGPNPINEKETIGFSAKTQINRTEFGMESMPGLGDMVTLEIELEANKMTEKP